MKKELAVLYSKLANSRKYYTHKITKEITDEYDIITCEKLQTKKMIINGQEIDRDLNASINIMFEGLKIYMESLIKC